MSEDMKNRIIKIKHSLLSTACAALKDVKKVL